MALGFRRPGFWSSYIALCTNPFPDAQMLKAVTQEVSLLGERTEEKKSPAKEGLYESRSTPPLISKDMCLLVLQLLFLARESLISFIPHYTCVRVCVESTARFFRVPLSLAYLKLRPYEWGLEMELQYISVNNNNKTL